LKFQGILSAKAITYLYSLRGLNAGLYAEAATDCSAIGYTV
jgi:hypothetical protein